MEQKVREATNNEPWGASTTLMSQIAAGTYNYREREEILSFIFRRFTEKAANEWRQIYKSLQLLEYLIKNGSERIIDDIRANLLPIQLLKSFHYVDSKGRDQGINVRNRTKNLVALLNDDSLIRLERKKARANAKKFGGVSSAAYGGASSIANGDGYGGDDDFTNRVFGDGGVFGARYDDPASAYNNGATGGDNNFEEYDVEPSAGASRTSKATTGSSAVHASTAQAESKTQPQAPEQDLLGDLMNFDAGPSTSSAQASAPAAAEDDDDDFDDFQSAPSLSATPATLTNNLANLYVSQPTSTPKYGQVQQQSQANYSAGGFETRVSSGPAKSSNDAFSSLFSSAKTKTTSTPKPAQAAASDFSFDDFTSAPAKSPQKPATQSSGTTNGEVDLLSF